MNDRAADAAIAIAATAVTALGAAALETRFRGLSRDLALLQATVATKVDTPGPYALSTPGAPVYVDGLRGSDADGPLRGSVLAPFKTLGAAQYALGFPSSQADFERGRAVYLAGGSAYVPSPVVRSLAFMVERGAEFTSGLSVAATNAHGSAAALELTVIGVGYPPINGAAPPLTIGAVRIAGTTPVFLQLECVAADISIVTPELPCVVRAYGCFLGIHAATVTGTAAQLLFSALASDSQFSSGQFFESFIACNNVATNPGEVSVFNSCTFPTATAWAGGDVWIDASSNYFFNLNGCTVVGGTKTVLNDIT